MAPLPIPAERDWLDDVLAGDARDHAAGYIADDGFTARMMAELPPAAPSVPRWRKPAVAVMWGLAAAGAAIALPEAAIDVGREAFRLLAAHPVSLPQIAATLAALGLATWGAAAYALRSE